MRHYKIYSAVINGYNRTVSGQKRLIEERFSPRQITYVGYVEVSYEVYKAHNELRFW